MRKVSASCIWIPDILTDNQKRVRAQPVKQLLKNVSEFNQKQFSNSLTGDETRVHYFEAVRKLGNKKGQTKPGLLLPEKHKHKE